LYLKKEIGYHRFFPKLLARIQEGKQLPQKLPSGFSGTFPEINQNNKKGGNY